MSKFIPKPLITIGFSTKSKTSGKISFEVDGNKVGNLTKEQRKEMLAAIDKIKSNLMGSKVNEAQHMIPFNPPLYSSGYTNTNVVNVKQPIMPAPTRKQIEDMKTLIREEKLLHAVKMYRDITGLGLKESKDYIDKLRIFVK